MKNSFNLKFYNLLFMLGISALPFRELPAQCYIVTSDYLIQFFAAHGDYMPARQGPFTKEECEYWLTQMEEWQRKETWCDCPPETNNSGSSDTQMQNEKKIVVEDRETQLKKIRLLEEMELRKKAQAECEEVNLKKKDLLGKMKTNKALDQLKTSSELSEQGAVNISNNQMEAGRDISESAFSDGKIILKRRQETNTVQVSPPKPVDSQKSLFEYIEHETRTVQNKIMNVQKEKIKLLEKKNDIQKTINEQTIKIAQLKTELLEAKDETQKEEIDSLLLMATELLQESEDLNIKADQELQEKNKLEQDNEALLNNYQDIYNKSKENPEQSEQLLKELRGDK
jgi:hypothetical protein